MLIISLLNQVFANEVSADILTKSKTLLLANRPLLAIDKVLNSTDMTLLDSINYIKEIDSSLKKIVNESVFKKIKVLLHRGQEEQASKLLKNKTNLDNVETKKYIEILQSSIVIHLPIQTEIEVVELFLTNNKMKAIDRIRSENLVGLKDAADYLSLVAKNVDVTITDNILSNHDSSYFQIKLPTKIKLYIESHFEKKDWGSIKWILSFYGIKSYEREKERVLLAIVKLADDDVNKFPALVAIAKIDYRDILMTEMTRNK